MDRNIVYPGSIPQDVDILYPNLNAMVALGLLMQAVLGSAPVADGLVCTPASSGLGVSVGPGCLTVLATVDATPYGSLAANTASPLVKMGLNITPTTLALSAPALTGQALNFLIQASFVEADGSPVVLPYVNAANPTQPFTGPANSGASTNSIRSQRVSVLAKAGVPAPAGTQTTPSPDAGFVGLYAVTVLQGQTAVSSAAISPLPGGPFLPFKLPQLTPGVSRMAVLTSNGSWTVPNNVTLLKLRLWGGGGAGGNGGGSGFVGGGGAGGGYVEGYFGVTPGSVLSVGVGAAGVVGSGAGSGGTTSIGSLATATGGNAGGPGSAGGAGLGSPYPGTGTVGVALVGNGYVASGLGGQNGILAGTTLISGQGGGANGGCGGLSASGTSGEVLSGLTANTPGAGGSGGVGTGTGGNGAPGQIIIEW